MKPVLIALGVLGGLFAFGAGGGDPVAAAAESELRRFRGRKETDPSVEPIIREYWTAVPSQKAFPGVGEVWSGAFVTYVANKGAPGSLAPYASHMLYAGYAEGGPGRYKALPANTPLKVGDIVVRNRSGGGLTFSDIRRGRHEDSHGDIVTSIQAGRARVVGGNLDDTVQGRTYALDSGGSVAPGQGVFAVLQRDT